MYQLRILGTPQVLDGNGKPISLSLGKPLAMLVYLACQGSPVPRDELGDLLWPEGGKTNRRHSVRQALWVLRNALGEDIFESQDPLSLKEGILQSDLDRFSANLAKGEIGEARELWAGPPLHHFFLVGVRGWNRWTDSLREDLEHRFGSALLEHSQELLKAGETETALSVLEQAVQVNPSSERSHLARIELLLQLLRLDAAREALADAHSALGDHQESAPALAALEARLQEVVVAQLSLMEEGDGFHMEFVGRSRELAELNTLWKDAERGRTRAAVITGPSGIGKTRLAREFKGHCSGGEIRHVELKGTRAESKLRWGSASNLVRQLLLLPGSAGISTASDSLLRSLLPSMGRDSVNLHSLSAIGPAAFLDAIIDLLEAVTFENTLVLLIDDFQWADPDSRTLLIGLASRCRKLRALFLFLGRPDLSPRRWGEMEAALTAEAGAKIFTLSPLIEEEVGEILALGATFPDPAQASEIVTKIHQASAGNPFFIREILRELHEQGVLRSDGQGWVFMTSEIPEEFELPENIKVLLRERLARLSAPAANLAATLAREDRAKPAVELREKTLLPQPAFTQAVTELLERGVIGWTDEVSLDFVHDLLRDTASSHLAGALPLQSRRAGWRSRIARGWMFLAAVGLALSLGVAVGKIGLPWRPAITPPPFGGGTIVLDGRWTPFGALRILEGSLAEWEWVTVTPPAPPGVVQTFRGPRNEFLWFGIEDREDGPDLVRILPDSTRIPLLQGPGDQSLQDVSPEGTRFLYAAENVGILPFSHSLYWAGIFGDQTPHLLFEGQGPLGMASWSPDGDLVAFFIVGAPDTLAVHALTGERIWARAFGELHWADWCRDRIILVADQGGGPTLLSVDPQDGEGTPLMPVPSKRPMACSPDGRAVVMIDVVDDRAAFVLRDLDSGETHPLPFGDVHDQAPAWIPDRVTLAPIGIRAEQKTITLGWGGRMALSAHVLYPDGSESDEEVWWESLDPNVANFNLEEELTGNEAGTTRVLARWRHSLQDTVVVVVEDRGISDSALDFRELWTELDTTRWIPFGSHPPRAATFEGASALQLLGDEKYSDGLVLREELSLDRGITIELDFRIEISEDVHQHLQLCLKDADPEKVHRDSGTLPDQGENLCFIYPSREHQKMDPSQVSMEVTPSVENRVRLPEDLPTSGWTHAALQVRPDGEASLVINRQRVATSPIRLSTVPHTRWTVVLDGDAVGTDVFVRDFAIWREVRY